MSLEEKLLIADVLDKMGVDVIEAGFAIASKGDLAAIQAVGKKVENAIVCSLARAIKGDIEEAAEAIKPAKRGRIHTFISTSKIHMEHQLKMSENQVIDAIKDSVTLARNLCDDVEWSGMDATRSDIDFLCKAVETAIHCGATTVNIPDTVGFTLPEEYQKTITSLIERVPNIDKAIISVHCHNDLGLAVANSLAAISSGARQIECTINGLGERAGNTSLEEIVMAIKTRNDLLPFRTNIDSTYITRASKLVSTITGFSVQKNKAIVGANAFAHESGIHQDGVLKHAATYEIMTPESVGLNRSNLTMGKHSGRAAFRNKLEELGFDLGDNAFQDAFLRFKALADKKKEIYDEDIISLIDSSAINTSKKHAALKSLKIQCGSEGDQTATLSLIVNDEEKTVTSIGDGPVDATFKAIKELTPVEAKLELYQVHAVTGGTDAQAEVTVRLVKDGRIASGNARNTDTIVASAEAYINALNKIIDRNTD
jgi:2-isopropylmalate synthase